MSPYLLSATFSKRPDEACDIHLRWSDGLEETICQTDPVLVIYARSAKQRAAKAPQPPSTNSQPWAEWLLKYADSYDRTHGGTPPDGYVAPSAEEPAVAEPQTPLFPAGGTGVEVVTDPVVLRRRALEAMGPGDYKAAAKAAGVKGYSKLSKAQLVDAVLAAEFPAPAPAVVEPEPAPEPTPVTTATTEGDQNGVPGKRGKRNKTKAREAAAASAPATELGEAHVVTPAPEPSPMPDITGALQAEAGGDNAPEVVSAEDAMAAAVAVFLTGNVKAVSERVAACEDRAQLDAALGAEQDGKARKGVIEALRVRIIALKTPAMPDPEERARLIRESVERILKGDTAQVAGMVGSVGLSPTPLDLDVLGAALTAEKQARRVRKGVVKAIEARIAALTPAGDIVAPAEGITDSETRPEVAGEGLGGTGVEMGGGMGLTGGAELGGGLGDGSGELSGGLIGESSGGLGGAGRDASPTKVPTRPGAGCKQPDKVDGWEAGRVLVVVKPHRGEFADWGKCEYRVRCDEDGGYTLIMLTGNRGKKDLGNLFEGKKWPYVSPMLTDLMGIERDAEGKPVRHHRMTLRRWFAMGRE